MLIRILRREFVRLLQRIAQFDDTHTVPEVLIDLETIANLLQLCVGIADQGKPQPTATIDAKLAPVK